MTKYILILFLFLLSVSTFGQSPTYINPTGIYKLEGKTTKNKGETYGYFGDVKVIAIDKEKVLIGFYVCKGAPSYNSASFIDTLKYTNNVVIYTGDTISDPTCNMTMKFSSKGIDVDLRSDNPNMACGFGHAVDTQGFYYKLKGRVPKAKEIISGNR